MGEQAEETLESLAGEVEAYRAQLAQALAREAETRKLADALAQKIILLRASRDRLTENLAQARADRARWEKKYRNETG